MDFVVGTIYFDLSKKNQDAGMMFFILDKENGHYKMHLVRHFVHLVDLNCENCRTKKS